MAVLKQVYEAIGGTPLLELSGYAKKHGCRAELFAKLECLNPAGSVKDRVALAMIEDAEARGKLKRGSVIIEPTSGNTGIGLASVACAKGYRVILTMPDSMSEERRKLLGAYGAEIVLTKGAEGMAGAIRKARELAEQTEGSFIPSQFENPVNAQIHYQTTGPEIWKDTQGKVNIFVAGVGTGGTISGVGRYLKEQNPNVTVVAVEPKTSDVLSGGRAGAHGIQGIGAGFVPSLLDTKIYDEVIAVSDEAALRASREFAKTAGILVGISSGAALAAACTLAKREKKAGKTVVVIFPDSGDRYLSTELFP